MYLTFWFHHQASSVPCMIQVSAPMAFIVVKYVWVRAERCGITFVSGRVSLANLGVLLTDIGIKVRTRTGHHNGNGSCGLVSSTILGPSLEQTGTYSDSSVGFAGQLIQPHGLPSTRL